MYLELQQQSILLGRRPSGFTEHYYTEWDDGLGKEKISLFLVMSIDSTQVPGAEIGKEAFQLLQDHFLDDLTGDPYDRFESALREVNLMVNEKEKELELKFIPNMQVVIGVIQKDMLFLSQRGASQGYLVRKRHVSSITDGLFDVNNKEDLFQNIASGSMEVGDSVIFVTGPLVQYITPSDVSKIFSEQSLQEAVKEMSDLLHQDLEEQMALLSFEVLEKSHVEAPVEVSSIKEDDNKPEEARPASATREQITRSLSVFRDWLIKRERWKGLDFMRRWDKKQLVMAMTSVVGVLVIGMLVLNVGLGRGKQLEALEGKLSVAEENITQAATRGAFDKTAAETLLNEAETLAVDVLNSGSLGGRASQLLDDVQEQRDFLDNIVTITDELALLADLSGLLGSTSITGVQPMGDRMVVYTDNEAYQVLLGDIQEPDVLDNSENVIAGAYFDDRDNIVFVTDEGNLLEYSDGNAQFADTSDGAFQSGVDVATYSTKIYLLDPENDSIWKYTRGTAGFGSAYSYMDEDQVDLTDAVSITIDGTVWVLHEDGTISRILSGENVPYYILKAPLTSIAGATDIYTELSINQLYVLDPSNDRILIYDKSSKTDDITYSQQYVFTDLKGTLTDVYVDKDRDVLVISTTEALYELGF
ncbi:MAG: hypothetical protein ACI9QC_000024 [Oceanicoccus sp.]|jgi:hypothetical protein